MFDFFSHLFDTTGFPPRWRCGAWSPAHGWLHVVADLGVWSAYVAIPCVIGYFVVRKKDVPFRTIFWLFVAFILACGTTHLMEALIFWWPAYRLAGLIKLGTAVVSWATVVALVPVTPRALAMPSNAELEAEIARRREAEAGLRAAHEQRVAERTAAAEERARQMQAALEENRVLLKEIHHRVKNNLQVISSLLDLQAQYTRDGAAVAMFRESRNRVRSMALVHERLYQSETFAHVDFGEYLRDLVAQLSDTYGVGPGTVRFDLDLAPVRLGIDAAVPCGLAVNELVSNCLKYAFPDGRGGVVRIGLAAADGEVALTVRDDGVGLPGPVTLDNAQTFGLRLVNALVDQLHGTACIERAGGTAVRITFPVKRPPTGRGGNPS